MAWYLVKLLLLLPLIAGMIWGSLKLTQIVQNRVGAGGRPGKGAGQRAVRIVETALLSPTLKLAVLEFHGREILVSVSRNGLTRLAEAPARLPASGPDLDR